VNKNKKVKDWTDHSERMNFMGLDLHKNYIQAAVVDRRGRVATEERIENVDEEIRRFFKSISTPTTRSKIVMNLPQLGIMPTNCFRLWAREIRSFFPIPSRQKAIASAKAKTDKTDAITHAQLLRGGCIPECYIPPRHILVLRELVRYRASLVRTRSHLKNKIHAILLMKGIKINVEYAPFTKEFVEELEKVGDYRIDGYLFVIDSLSEQIKQVSKQIKHEAVLDESAKLLMTIPGVGYYSALLITSEIGDIDRFSDSHHLCSYADLAPSTGPAEILPIH
jgi:transposase